MFLGFKKFFKLNINKNDKVVLLDILNLKLSEVSVEQMELYTDTQNCEAVNNAFFRSLLFANEFASEFVTKFFPKSYL